MNRMPPPRPSPPPPGGRRPQVSSNVRPNVRALPALPPTALKALVVLTALACLGARLAAMGG